MRILQVAERTYPARGGVEVHTARISEELVKKGHEVTLAVFNSVDPRDCGHGFTYQKPNLVIKPNKPILPTEESWHGVRILRFESKMQLYSYYWSPSMLVWLMENSGEYDVMHTHTLRFSNNEFTGLAHIKTKTPFVITGHDKLKLDHMGMLALTLDKAYRATTGRVLLGLAKRIIAFDKEYSADYQKLYGVAENKIRIIPNGVDYMHFSHLPNGDQLKNSLGNPEHIILYLGRFVDYKKPDLLIASFKSVLERFPKSCLLMVGKDYGLLSYCKELVSNLGLKQKVVFMENAEEEAKLMALNIADVCVIPSEYESSSIVTLEAQASGLPLIASKTGGMKFLIDEGKTGLFLNERTPKEISEKIVFLLGNNDLRIKMGFEAKINASRYSWEEVVDKLLEVYREIS